MHLFVAICFLSGALAGKCLDEAQDQTFEANRDRFTCETFIAKVRDNETYAALRDAGIEYRYRCVVDS